MKVECLWVCMCMLNQIQVFSECKMAYGGDGLLRLWPSDTRLQAKGGFACLFLREMFKISKVVPKDSQVVSVSQLWAGTVKGAAFDKINGKTGGREKMDIKNK